MEFTFQRPIEQGHSFGRPEAYAFEGFFVATEDPGLPTVKWRFETVSDLPVKLAYIFLFQSVTIWRVGYDKTLIRRGSTRKEVAYIEIDYLVKPQIFQLISYPYNLAFFFFRTVDSERWGL